MSGSSQNRESPHFYIVILHAGAVLKDFMPYPAPDGVAADFLRAGDAVAEGDVQRISFQGAELIADAPPVIAAQGDAAVLDDRAAVARSLPRASMGFAPFFISCFAMLSGCLMVMSQLSTTARVLSPTIRKMVSQYSARTVQSSIRTSVMPLCPSVMNHTGR